MKSLLLLALFASLPAFAQAPAQDPQIAHIEHGLLPSVIVTGQPPAGMALAERMEHYHVPAVSIAFIDHGKLAWARAYGLADITTHSPATTETLFQAASISKPIATFAALRLVEQHKLSLDADINTELHSWHVPENDFTREQKVTLRRVLSHSAGLTMHGSAGYGPGEAIPTILQILDAQKPAKNEPVRVAAVPGAQYAYSGGGFALLQLLLEDTTGKPFATLQQETVLTPMGMTHSTYEQPLPVSLQANAATGHDGEGHPIPGRFRTIPERAEGGLWTTPSDLAHAAIELQREYADTSHAVLSTAMAHEMLARQKDNRGLGWEIEKPGDTPRFAHYGVNPGFDSVMQIYRDTGQGIVIMTNGQNGEQLINEILRAVAVEYHWPNFRPIEHTLARTDAASLPAFAGTYLLPNADGDDKLTVTLERDHLFLKGSYSVGGAYHFTLSDPVELLPEGPQEFFTLSTGAATFRFAEGKCTIVNGTAQREAVKQPGAVP